VVRAAVISRFVAGSPSAPFQQLDFLYVPSDDVAADVAFFTDILGGRVVFAIDGMGTRVAAVELTESPPLLLLTDHLEGERPILVYRVPDLAAALDELEARGWQRERTFEIPHGPCCSFRSTAGHRIALYQLTRPDVAEHFVGRRDF
jgi:glyoxalase/bleomycin resistance protein/dioxygenase superfamily protein